MPEFSDVLPLLQKAFAQLELATSTPVLEPRDLAGIIKSFEFVFELSWKCIQAAARAEGREAVTPRAAFTEAFRVGWVSDPVVWKGILEDRNKTVHTYNEEFAKLMSERIARDYVPAFSALVATLSAWSPL